LPTQEAFLVGSADPGRCVAGNKRRGAGDSGGKPLSQVIDAESEELGFLFWQLGMTGAKDASRIAAS
jgi:hypothetical protein